MKISLIQNPGPETYEVESIANGLNRHGATVNISSVGNINELPDVVILRNNKSHDYKIFKQMENLGTRFINKLDAHYLVSDKWLKYENLMKAKMRVPKTLLISIPFDHTDAEKIGDELGYPCVIKRRFGAYGIGVELCQDENHLYNIAKRFSKEFNDKTMLAQKYISYSPDYVSLSWIGGITYAHIAVAPKNDTSFLSYKRGEYLSSRKPYTIDSELRSIVQMAIEYCELEISRLDILFDRDGYIICEINSPGGFRGSEKIHNVDIGQMIANYIIGVVK